VNIKILLDGRVAAGELTTEERNTLLASMTDEVAALVLAHNSAQTLALVIARRQAAPMANVHARYIDVLETEGWLDRALEFLPSDKQIAERQLAGGGLTTPEFAVLIAYTKTTNAHLLERSDTPDDPYLEPALVDYFPVELRRRFVAEIRGHRLRREIVATQIANQMTNLSGISFDHRMTEDTGAGVVDVTRAWVASRDIFDFVGQWSEIEQLDRAVKLDVQLDLFLELRRMIERGTLWLLRHRRPPLDIAVAVDEFRKPMAELVASIDAAVVGHRREQQFALEASRLAANVPEPLAQRSTLWPLLHTGFDVIELAGRTGESVADVATAYWAVFDLLDVGWLWDAIGALPRADRWQTQARSALRDDLLVALADLADDALYVGSAAAWVTANERVVARTMAMFTEIRRTGHLDVGILSVALRQLRNLSLITERGEQPLA
jgi:glutamate dehydrogenase